MDNRRSPRHDSEWRAHAFGVVAREVAHDDVVARGHVLDREYPRVARLEIWIARLSDVRLLTDLVRAGLDGSGRVAAVRDREFVVGHVGLEHDRFVLNRARVLHGEGDIARRYRA